jgi:hypothetical protein
VIAGTILLLGVLADEERERLEHTRRQKDSGKRTQVGMNTVTGSRKAKESVLAPTTLAGTTWPVEKPEIRALGEWIEFGRKLRSVSDEEILSLIGSVVMYLNDKLNDETSPSTFNNNKEYVRGYANTILEAAQAELAKRHSERPG